MILREYQRRAIGEVRQAWGAGARNVLCVLPTGSGKTVIMADMIRAAVAKGRRVAVCAHRRELVGQLSRKLDETDVPHGMIQSGHHRIDRSAPVQVCSVQTLTARGESPDADVLIFDEAHHLAAATWGDVVASYTGIEAVLGFTATPERGDRAPLGDVFDAMVVPIQVAELVHLGFLVPSDVIAPAAPQTDLAEHPVAAYQRIAPGSKAVVFVGGVDEADDIAAQFRAAGVKARSVSSKTPPIERIALLGGVDETGRIVDGAVRRGEIDVLVNVNVLTEGFDCPELSCVIISRGCSAASTWLQMIGRGLRPVRGTARPGERATIIDLRGHVHAYGLPGEARNYALSGKAIRRQQDRLALRMCASCGAVDVPRDVCPRCGHVLPPPPRATVKWAPMRAVTTEDLEEERAKKKAWLSAFVSTEDARRYPDLVKLRFKQEFGHEIPPGLMPGSASSGSMRERFEALVREAREKGYQKPWVYAKFRAIFRCAPRWKFEDVE